ncbi:MAG: nucleoside hydrolase-like domain-containing protein [Bacteroidota bacterium]
MHMLFLSLLLMYASLTPQPWQKPKVWIYTDMTDGSLPGDNHMGTINDPDDISAMAGYLLMANHFETLQIVVGSTHRKEHKSTPDQAAWAKTFFGQAYAEDLPNLQAEIGGYPDSLPIMQSAIKESAERFDPSKSYSDLSSYSSITPLYGFAERSTSPIHVLCWGSLTEAAILVKHCQTQQRNEILQNLVFIAHWTNSPWHQGSPEQPEDVANCREDAEACAYLKEMALNGHIRYYECGAIGQHGIVSGAPKGEEYYEVFKQSQLGKIFAEGKFRHGCVDHSDSATYWSLLGNWGVSLQDIASNGRNFPEVEKANEARFKAQSPAIHAELLRRVKIAAGK